MGFRSCALIAVLVLVPITVSASAARSTNQVDILGPHLTLGPLSPVAFNQPPLTLNYFPDAHMAVTRSSGKLEVYAADGDSPGHTYRLTGVSMGTLTFEPASPVLSASTSGFDRSYAGITAVLQAGAANSDDRIAFYHAEQDSSSACPDLHSSVLGVGLATSTDGGVTWVKRGQVLRLNDQPGYCQLPNQSFVGDGGPSVVEPPAGRPGHGYVWLFYPRWATSSGTPTAIEVARAAVVSAGHSSAYMKYDGQQWTPGLGGNAQAVIQPTSSGCARSAESTCSEGYVSYLSVSWNSFFHEYLAIIETNQGFALSESADLIHWTPSSVFWRFQPPQFPYTTGQLWFSYPTLLAANTSGSDPTDTSQINYLYVSEGVRNEGGDRMIRRPLFFGNPNLPSSIDHPKPTAQQPVATWTPSGQQSAFAWSCTGDLRVTGPNGTLNLYSDGHAGHQLVLEPGNEVSQIAFPYGGSCRAAYSADLSGLAWRDLQDMFAQGCGSSCSDVRTVELDGSGNIVSDLVSTR
jgi:hypothetical protein